MDVNLIVNFAVTITLAQEKMEFSRIKVAPRLYKWFLKIFKGLEEYISLEPQNIQTCY